MPSKEQTFLVQLQGGLDTISDRTALFSTPGKAVKMINFEGGIRGGYRRINGYTQYSTASPDGLGILAVVAAHGYFDGCIAIQGGNVYFSADSLSWLQVNRDTGDTFVDEAALVALSILPRVTTGAENYHFTEWHNGADTEIYFADTQGVNPLGRIVIRDNAGTIEYKYQHAAEDSWGIGNTKYPTSVQIHNERLVVSGDPDYKNELYYSNLLDPFDFIGGGVVIITDEIVWQSTFRENLIVFGKRSIRGIAGLGDPQLQNMETITAKIGCIAGGSVQEFAGGLIFLAPDGLRTVSATARIDDFELGTLTTNIHDEILEIVRDIDQGALAASAVIRGRNQYRLFSNRTGTSITGIGGVIRQTQGGVNIEWNTFQDYPVNSISSSHDSDSNDIIFQTSDDPYVYLHDEGPTFNGVDIIAYFQTPRMVMNDPNFRKTLSTIEIYTDIEGPVDYSFKVLFDEGFRNSASPGVYPLDAPLPISVYGVSLYDDPLSTYDAGDLQVQRVHVQGSGRFISLLFQSRGSSSPFTLQSLNISYFLNGRF